MSDTDSPGKEGLLEEAAAWFARMRAPDAEENRLEFEKWLARGALHRRAYNRAAEVFAMGKLLAEDEQHDGVRGPHTKWRELRLLGGITAAALVLTTTGLLLFQTGLRDRNGANGVALNSVSATGPVAELSTANAPQAIRLSDNSLVRLASGSSLAVQFGGGERRLLLEGGSARFYVAHEMRPFIVAAGGGYVVAHGTVFDVAIANDRQVTVGLIQGAVDVTAPTTSNELARERRKRRLRPGETMSFAAVIAPGSAAATSKSSSDAVMPGNGPTGAVEFSSISLAELVRVANQRSARQIRIADPRTAQLHVSGTFRIDDTEVLAERLSALFNLVVDRSNQAQIVLKSPEPRAATKPVA